MFKADSIDKKSRNVVDQRHILATDQMYLRINKKSFEYFFFFGTSKNYFFIYIYIPGLL